VPETSDRAPRGARRARRVDGGASPPRGTEPHALIEAPGRGSRRRSCDPRSRVGVAASWVTGSPRAGRANPIVPLASSHRASSMSRRNAVTFVVYARGAGVFFPAVLVPPDLAGALIAVAPGAALLSPDVADCCSCPSIGATCAAHRPRIPLNVGPLLVGSGCVMARIQSRGTLTSPRLLTAVIVFQPGVFTLVASPVTANATCGG